MQKLYRMKFVFIYYIYIHTRIYRYTYKKEIFNYNELNIVRYLIKLSYYFNNFTVHLFFRKQ